MTAPAGTPTQLIGKVLKGRRGRDEGSSGYIETIEELKWRLPDEIDRSEIVGVYEQYLGSGSEAIIFLRDRLFILSESGALVHNTVVYGDLGGLFPFPKDGSADSVVVQLSDKSTVLIPCRAEAGDVSLLGRLVMGLIGACQRKK